LKTHLKSTVNNRDVLVSQDRGTTARCVIGAARRKVDRVRCNVAVTEKPTSETKQVCQFRVRTGQSSICMLRNQKLYLLF
jgi:hypothetical protein